MLQTAALCSLPARLQEQLRAASLPRRREGLGNKWLPAPVYLQAYKSGVTTPSQADGHHAARSTLAGVNCTLPTSKWLIYKV